MDKENFDLIVIGAGPGGYSAALHAANFSKKVALIEKKDIGGTCLDRGCIPTKSLIHSANLFFEMKNSKKFGIDFENISIDFQNMTLRKNEVVKNLKNSLKNLILSKKITIFENKASFLNQNEILLDNNKDVQTLGTIKLPPTTYSSEDTPSDLWMKFQVTNYHTQSASIYIDSLYMMPTNGYRYIDLKTAGQSSNDYIKDDGINDRVGYYAGATDEFAPVVIWKGSPIKLIPDVDQRIYVIMQAKDDGSTNNYSPFLNLGMKVKYRPRRLTI